MKPDLRLEFVEYKPEAYVEILKKLCHGDRKKVRLRPLNAVSSDVALRAVGESLNVLFSVAPREQQVTLPNCVSVTEDIGEDDITLLFISEARILAACLLDYLDVDGGIVVAPITEYSFRNKPLFVISIPKSGTHLLIELVRLFGYGDGVVCPGEPQPGLWYCLESSNTHTTARRFFIDTVHESHFGNRLHPFVRCPAVFMYRSPMDIVVSEANYYHEDGKTVFSSYLSHLSFEERLLRLIDDPSLLGTIMDRVGNFVAWLDFQNVIPISFEELVGENGGGSQDVQRRLIWSLQLKLQVPGDPGYFGEKVFNPSSPTFTHGRVGSHWAQFSAQARNKFRSLPQDVMIKLGFDFAEHADVLSIPKRAEEFRRRPVKYSHANFDDTPVALEYNFQDCNIVRYRGQYYILPQSLGSIDLSNEASLGWKKLLITTCETLEGARRNIYKSDSVAQPLFWKKHAARMLGRVCRFRLPTQFGC